MGFLDNSSVTVDAILTKRGRELLAEGRDKFQITQFALADDEVDYEIITQYGRIIGREKIEKNTPIFEAITNDKFALKYPLRNLRTNTNILSVFPSIVLKNSSETFRLSSNASSTTTKRIEFKTFVDQDSGFTLDESVVDNTVTVKVVDKLLRLNSQSSTLESNIRVYNNVPVSTSTIDFNNQIEGSIEITTLNVVNDSTYQYTRRQATQHLLELKLK